MGSCAFLSLIIAACLFTINAESNEHQLYKFLTEQSNTAVRPVTNSSETVQVKFGLSLISILNADEETNTLTSQVWIRMLWKDVYLSWEPSDYGGLSTIRIPKDKIWRPDIVLYNAAEKGATHYDDALAVVYSSGDVLWIPPTIVKSSCRFDMTRFPFDSQQCLLKFGSWTYDGFMIDLDFYDGLKEVDTADYILNNKWKLEEAPATLNVKYYPCCQEPYPDLTFTIKFKRIAGLQCLLYVAPIVLIAILSPFMFLLPSSQTQRFTLGGSLLICLAVLLASLERIFLTAEAVVPNIAKYYISISILLMLSLIFSAIIANLADRSNGNFALPKIIKKIFVDGLGKVVCVSSANQAEVNGSPEDGSTEKKKKAPGGKASDWRALATVLDRVFFIIYVILTIILSLAFLT